MCEDIYEFLHSDYRNRLTRAQKRIVYEMFSIHSEVYRSDYKTDNKDKRAIWNSVIVELPKCEKRKVYRYLNEHDKTDFRIGEIFEINHSLTTTKKGRKFTAPSNYIGKYIVTCKPSKWTRAHDVSVLWDSNWSILKSEEQVNFEEKTSFQINNIKMVHGKPYIHMHEI